MAQVHGVNSTGVSEVYLINIRLPNGVAFMHVQVTKGQLVGPVDVLIGMDIITQGDFSVTNKDGKTVFSFRVPSEVHTDYVREFNEKQLKEKQTHGGSKAERKKTPKKFAKNKKKE